MYITKSQPVIVQDGKIKEGIEIRKGVLWIGKNIKFEKGRWNRLGDDRKWYFLGYGANPAIETTKDGVVNQELFDTVFEEVEA